MDSQSMQQATREAVKKRFGKKRLLASKVVPHYPQSLEREYVRVTNVYMKLLNDTLAEYIPQVCDVLEMGRRTDAKEDKESKKPRRNFIHNIDTLFDAILCDLENRQGLELLHKKIEHLSQQSWKRSIHEWKRVVKRTLGINLMDDYYRGSNFKKLIDKWVADNIAMIKTIPQEMLGSMRNIVKNGYLTGASNNTIAKQIQETYGVKKYHAQFYARDQTTKLNAQIAQEQQRDAGVDEYIWRTAGNISTFPNTGRVRKGHARLNNKHFKYSAPPVVDDKTGRRANPGEDYQCRCIALPVFDIETVILPWEKEASKG